MMRFERYAEIVYVSHTLNLIVISLRVNLG